MSDIQRWDFISFDPTFGPQLSTGVVTAVPSPSPRRHADHAGQIRVIHRVHSTYDDDYT